MAEQINIGGRLHSTATGNVVTGANEILDDNKNKKQNVINAETDARFSSLDVKTDNTNTSVTNINNRLSVVEELAEISVEGGEIGIATVLDFDNPTTEQKAKVTTVGAILDTISVKTISDDEMDEVLNGELPVYLTDVNGNAVLDNNGKPIEII